MGAHPPQTWGFMPTQLLSPTFQAERVGMGLERLPNFPI